MDEWRGGQEHKLIRWRLIPFAALLNESSTQLDSPLLTSAVDEASKKLYQ